MPTTYAAQGSVISATKPWTKVSITSVANTTPITLTFNVAHGFNQTDTVLVEATGINTIDGNQFQVNVLNTTQVQLLGTTASGSSATGYAIDMQLLPAASLPAGGELADPNVVGAALEWAANPAPFLYQRCGKYSAFQGFYAAGGNPLGTNISGSNWATLNLAAFGSTWRALSFQTLQGMSIGGVAPYVKSSDGFYFETTFSLQYTTNNNTDFIPLAFGLFFYQGGLVQPSMAPFATAVIEFTSLQFSTPPSSFVDYKSVDLAGYIPNLLINGGGGLTLPASNLGIAVGYFTDVSAIIGGGASIKAIGPWIMSGMQYRAN